MERQEGYGPVPAKNEGTRHRDSAEPRRSVPSEQLFEGARELIIFHDGCEYVLRLTRQNKLILTK